MNTTPTNQTSALGALASSRICGCMLALLSLTLASTTSMAQTVVIRSLPLRITVPKGVASNVVATLSITLSGTFTSGVNFAVTGTPPGCTATLSTNNINVAGTHTATLSFGSPSTLAAGNYDLAVDASGEASYRLPVPVNCSFIWSGAAFTGATSTNFNTPGNWLGGAVPGTADDVVLRDLGAVAGLTAATNVIVSADTEIGSLRFGSETNATRAYNIEIRSGATLAITGSNGLTQLRDFKGQTIQIDSRFTGAGRLVVSNSSALLASFVDGQGNNNLDLQGLNELYVDVARIPLGDYRAYPNMSTNGYTGGGGTGVNSEPSRFLPLVWLARTNVIKASFVDPNSYNDLGVCDYALTVANYHLQGSTSNPRFTLGTSNAFFLDSICFSQSMSGGSANNYNFLNGGSTVLFRGIGGLASRMSVFAIGDARDPDPSAANVRGQVNFANVTNCVVDALVDRLLLAVDRTNHSGACTIQGSLTFGAGTFDVNDAFLGYQRSGDCPSGNVGGFAGPEGTVNVNSNASSGGALFRINRDLNLGYTTASASGGNPTAERCFGKVIINGGTCAASNILVGGVTKISTNNVIVLNTGKLFVTNAIGAANGRLANLTATNGSQITLLGVKVGETNVHVVTLSAPAVGANSTLLIPSIANLSTLPAKIPVISYVTDSPAFNGLSVVPPAGLYIRSIIDNTTDKTIDITFTDVAPQVLVWQGGVNSSWSTNAADKNWGTLVGGIQTNFTDGDSVIFDDTASGASSITVVDTVTPGQTAAQFGLVVSNSVKNYTFDGSTVLGGSTLKKVGTGALTINIPFSPGVTLSGGSLAGVGSVGSTLLENGTTMTGFSGGISGGLTASNANVAVSGTVAGGLTIRAGSLLNNGTINGPVTLATNVTLNNTVNAAMNVVLPWTVPTNSTLINNGTIVHSGVNGGNQGLTVNGTLSGVGRITQSGTQLSSDVRVTMGAGGTLQIGNTPGEITNNIIAVRLDFLAGSTSTFDADNATLANDKVYLQDGFIQGKVNFGAGNNLGGRFVVNKTAGPDFGLSTTLNLFDLTSNGPDNVQQAIPGVIPPPAPGLSWDVSRVVTNLTIRVFGPAFMTNSIANGTNLVFEWPEAYRGWRLERQTNNLATGLAWNSTNWTTLVTSYGGSYSNNTVVIDNNTNILYFRSVQAMTKTNPVVFYRLTYP
jgi:hypothetical protein